MKLGDKFKSRTPFTFIVVLKSGRRFEEYRDLEGRVIGKNTDKDPNKSFVMIKPPHDEQINYCRVTFLDYEKYNKFTNAHENMKGAKKSGAILDYKDDIIKPMKDLVVGKEYVWIMGMSPMLVRYTGPGKKEFTFNFEFVAPEKGNHDLSIRDVREYIKFKLDENKMKSKSPKRLKLENLIRRLIKEESGIIGDMDKSFFKDQKK